ncbi:MAG TPA: type I 3-dehydroquinate dehydratase, partial [Chloroflexota bacterium]|nr:type I 3-dehydroquinate dehydratase [Chloroflexota bacterium]
EWWVELARLGGDVVKVVGTAHDVRDCLEVARTFAQADQPTIAIAMGEHGMLTRVLALREPTCVLTYAALDTGSGTAPGQITAREMRDVYRVGRLDETTRVYGLLGPHAEDARLSEYNAWFAADDVPGVAVPFLADCDAAAIVAAFRELPVSGWHIHGQALQADVPAVVDVVSPRAARQGKVNGVTRGADGALHGEWVESPREQYELWRSL